MSDVIFSITPENWDFQTEPSAAGARRVVTSVWVPTIPKPSAGARSQPAEDDEIDEDENDENGEYEDDDD